MRVCDLQYNEVATPPKAAHPVNPRNPRVKNASGKLVIVAIVAIAVAAAGVSWWFRYDVTHRAAEFWGPKTARLIRDAPIVQFWTHDPPTNLPELIASEVSAESTRDPSTVQDVTHARGFVHLRNALLDDRSFRWPPNPPAPGTDWKWMLRFQNEVANEDSILVLSSDCRFIADFDRPYEALSCEPIAAGLAQVFAELSSQPAAPSR
jgi:hypothetical protein